MNTFRTESCHSAVRLMLTCTCAIRKQVQQVRHLLSLKQGQKKGLQYQEQDFDSIQEWLSLKP